MDIKPLRTPKPKISYQTPKGWVYRLGKYSKFYKDKSFKKSDIYYFLDLGDKASFYSVHFGKTGKNNTFRYWFNIKNGLLSISKTRIGGFSRNITNAPNQMSIVINSPILKRNFKTIFLKWARRNGFKIKRKWNKYSFENILLLFAYPGLEYIYDIHPHFLQEGRINSIYTSDLKGAKGYNHILTRIYGSHGKTIKKLPISNAHFSAARAVKGLIPLEKLVEHFTKSSRITNFIDFSWGYPQKMRKFLRNFHQDTVIKYLECLFKKEDLQLYPKSPKFGRDKRWFLETYLRDSINMYNMYPTIPLPNTNDIKEIHDYYSLESRKIEDAPVSFEKIVNKYLDINNIIFGDFRIEVPADSEKLREYGQTLSNCIFSYKKRMLEGSILLLGVYKNNELKYNISICGKELDQFLGKHNNIPDFEDKKVVLTFLLDKGLLKNIPAEPIPAIQREVEVAPVVDDTEWLNRPRQDLVEALPF